MESTRRMLIECPRCNARLEMDRARATQRLARVRCAACEHGWIARLATPADAPPPPVIELDLSAIEAVAPQPPPPAEPPPVTVAVEAPREARDIAAVVAPPKPHERYVKPRPRATARRPAPPRLRPALRALAIAASVVTLPSLAIAKKDSVVGVVPQTAGLYAAIGLPVNLRGLQLREVKSLLGEEGPRRILMVEGQIVNARAVSLRTPDLRLSVRDAAGREIYHWVSPPPKGEIAGGESVPFRARLVAAPEDGADVKIQFVDATPSPMPAPAAPPAKKPGK